MGAILSREVGGRFNLKPDEAKIGVYSQFLSNIAPIMDYLNTGLLKNVKLG